MPAAEADAVYDEQEIASYELAYHVLPTVADGEVSNVRDRVVAHITELGGTLGEEEVPQRFDLAYDIEKYLEGKNRKFSSAYFGWVRFRIHPESIGALTEAVSQERELLRHLLLRLSKYEAAHPFYFHEALAAEQKVEDVEAEVAPDVDPNESTTEEAVDTSNVSADATATSTEETADVTEDPADEERSKS